jgi:hypothetical protein
VDATALQSLAQRYGPVVKSFAISHKVLFFDCVLVDGLTSLCQRAKSVGLRRSLLKTENRCWRVTLKAFACFPMPGKVVLPLFTGRRFVTDAFMIAH